MALGRIGWFGEDIADTVEDAVDTVTDTAGDIISVIPGGDPLLGAMHDLVTGPLRDFAKTGVGAVVLKAIASSFTGATAWTLGPQLASIFWATPGILRGDSFEEAWISEFKDRVEQTVEIVGVPEEITGQFGELLKLLPDYFQPGEIITASAKELASRFHVREDVAEFAKSFWNHAELPSWRGRYDPATGRELLTVNAWAMNPDLAAQAARVLSPVYRATRSPLSQQSQFVAGRFLQPAAPLEENVRAYEPPPEMSPAPSRAVAWAFAGAGAAALGTLVWYRYFR